MLNDRCAHFIPVAGTLRLDFSALAQYTQCVATAIEQVSITLCN